MRKVPGIGDIPILGRLFRSKAARKDQTELVVMITPHILARDSTGVTDALPRLQEPFLPRLPDNESLPQSPPAFVEPGR
jgi:pilus assembly protein CpaC